MYPMKSYQFHFNILYYISWKMLHFFGFNQKKNHWFYRDKGPMPGKPCVFDPIAAEAVATCMKQNFCKTSLWFLVFLFQDDLVVMDRWSRLLNWCQNSLHNEWMHIFFLNFWKDEKKKQADLSIVLNSTGINSGKK